LAFIIASNQRSKRFGVRLQILVVRRGIRMGRRQGLVIGRREQDEPCLEGGQPVEQDSVVLEERIERRGAGEGLVHAIADEDHRRAPFFHFFEQPGETFGVAQAAGAGGAAHGVTAPTEIAERQAAARMMTKQPRFQVAVQPLLLDEAAAQKDDAVAVGQFGRCAGLVGAQRPRDSQDQKGRNGEFHGHEVEFEVHGNAVHDPGLSVSLDAEVSARRQTSA
jgi:hypothetical protein